MRYKFLVCFLILISFKSLAAEEIMAFKSPEKVALNSDESKKILTEVEKYLNSISTIKAKFIQSASNGSYSEGLFYLNRPGKKQVSIII